jgi:death on curing protein
LPTYKHIDIDTTILIHDDLIQTYGGLPGMNREGMIKLESALAQPMATFDGTLLHPSKEEQAAAYLFHICMAHAFLDGNKRTSVAVMETFIALNGWTLLASNQELEYMVLNVANNKYTKGELSYILGKNMIL